MGSGRSHPTDESVDRGILSKLVGEAPRTSGKFRLALCMVLGIALAFSIPLSNEPLLFDIFLVCMILMGGLQALGDLLYRRSRAVGQWLRLAGLAAGATGFALFDVFLWREGQWGWFAWSMIVYAAGVIWLVTSLIRDEPHHRRS